MGVIMTNMMSGGSKDEGKEGGWFAQWAMAANRFETLTQQLTEPSVLSQTDGTVGSFPPNPPAFLK
jgi:hypothetical protein